MTVSEMIEKLQEVSGDLVVVISKDGEGNEFSPLETGSVGCYAPDSTWSGSFEHPDDQDGAAPNALCLWPVN